MFFLAAKLFMVLIKGKKYKAWVNRLGRIRFNGKRYDTPTAAGKAIITKGAVNGWNFWKYKDKSGSLSKNQESQRQLSQLIESYSTPLRATLRS